MSTEPTVVGSDLRRIHRLALHPAKVGSILAGIALSFGAVELAAIHGGITTHLAPGPRQFVQLPALLAQGRWWHLIAVFGWMTFVWATLGGGATRRMTQDVTGEAPEPLWRSIAFCFRWALAAPSMLASSCFFFILLAPSHPWLLLLVLPTWLYAGFLYGALTSERISLGTALIRAHARLRNTAVVARFQFKFLISFAWSTAAGYAIAATYVLTVALMFARLRGAPLFSEMTPLQWALMLPVALYALGYTTSNLKSLQIYLYTQVPEVPSHAVVGDIAEDYFFLWSIDADDLSKLRYSGVRPVIENGRAWVALVVVRFERLAVVGLPIPVTPTCGGLVLVCDYDVHIPGGEVQVRRGNYFLRAFTDSKWMALGSRFSGTGAADLATIKLSRDDAGVRVALDGTIITMSADPADRQHHDQLVALFRNNHSGVVGAGAGAEATAQFTALDKDHWNMESHPFTVAGDPLMQDVDATPEIGFETSNNQGRWAHLERVASDG